MTVQIQDEMTYKNKKFTIVATSNSLQFNPEKYGVKPLFRSTSCWRGFWCHYKIVNYELQLKDLFINTFKNYPQIEGVNAKESLKERGYHVYENLHLKMLYTGKLLLGSEILDEYRLFKGLEGYPYIFKVLLECNIVDGKVIEITDCSQIGAEFKNRIEKTLDAIPNRIEDELGIIKDSLLPDYSEKIWWFSNKEIL